MLIAALDNVLLWIIPSRLLRGHAARSTVQRPSVGRRAPLRTSSEVLRRRGLAWKLFFKRPILLQSQPPCTLKTLKRNVMNTKKNKNTDSPHFREFFLDQIKDVYWAEKHLSSGLKKMRKAATSPKLAAAFEKHIEETAGQIERLKRVFELLGKTPQAKKCEAMEGLVSEAESMIEDTRKDSYTRDAGLILAAQKAEHYEIASYGSLKVFAEMMGETEIARELGMILKEEVSTDSLLSCLAEEDVNEMAVAE